MNGEDLVLPDDLGVDDFAPHVNSVFEARREKGAVLQMELIDASQLSSTPAQNQFRLHFRAPVSTAPQQGIFRITHPLRGPLDIFLVPIAGAQEGVLYEAIFNQLVSKREGNR